MQSVQRRLVVIDEHVDDLYGSKVRAYFQARGMRPGTDFEILRLPMVEEEKSIELVMKVSPALTTPRLSVCVGTCARAL